MPATHAEINAIVNTFASRVDERRLQSIMATARQWQRLGLSAQAIAKLVGFVPVRQL